VRSTPVVQAGSLAWLFLVVVESRHGPACGGRMEVSIDGAGNTGLSLLLLVEDEEETRSVSTLAVV
jgi:hypothetical protein